MPVDETKPKIPVGICATVCSIHLVYRNIGVAGGLSGVLKAKIILSCNLKSAGY